MKTSNENEKAPEEAWPVRPYSKRELAEAYAPNISPVPGSGIKPNCSSNKREPI